MKFSSLVAIALLGAWSLAFSAHADTVTGVVTNIGIKNKTVTVLDDADGRRQTYMLMDSTKYMSDESEISLDQIKRGNTVILNFRSTESGRDIIDLSASSVDEVSDIPALNDNSPKTISGRVTGVRNASRTVTIREDATRRLHTLNVPEDVQINRDGGLITLSEINRGEKLTARFRRTEAGPTLVGAENSIVEEEPMQTVAELPKTGGHAFAYLILAVGAFTGAGALRLYRRQSAGRG